MNNQPLNIGGFRALRIMHAVMLFGMIMFCVVIYFVGQDETSSPLESFQQEAFLASLVLGMICLFISSFLWKKDLQKIQTGPVDLKGKLELYRTAAIRRYALAEAPALFSMVGYFLTREPRLFIVVAVMIAYFISIAPTPSRVGMQIGETPEDISNS